MLEESEDLLGLEVREVERDDGPTAAAGEEPEEQGERIPIAADRVGAHAADPR